MGIVISKTLIQDRWMNAQMGAHGWAAIANLAGIPYDCLFLSDLISHKNLSRYKLLVLTQCAYVNNQLYPELVPALEKFIGGDGGNLIVEGPLAVYDENSRDRDHSEVDQILDMAYIGFKGDSTTRIKVSENTQYITRLFEVGQYITQPLENGLNILRFQTGGKVLLTSADNNETYPYLSQKEFSKSRVILISDLHTWSGVASFFRNDPPQVFYANQIYEILVRTIHWVLYGDQNNGFPVPQLSNANMTVIGRLDADVSENLDYQIKTINFLISIARESGVVPLYGWVSSAATRAGWPNLAPLGKKLEEVGGEIGSHSKHHEIDQEMNQQRWEAELDGSIKEIEFGTSDMGFPIGEVDLFINPGNTIPLYDYGQIASRFVFMMTHGFSQNVPLGYGNVTWYTGSNRNFCVVEETPNMDYQWFYDSSWSYTTAQITAYQEAIFDYMYRHVGRGVIFNETWHDYSINSAQFNQGKRIINKDNMPFYLALKAKYANHDIYCPEPEDLVNKLRAMAQWDYRWSSQKKEIHIELDLSGLAHDTIAQCIGGMAIKIENTPEFVHEVFINDQIHHAFSDDRVILPNLKRGMNRIRVILGDRPADKPHLTFVSKRMTGIRKSGNDLEFDLKTRSIAKFNIFIKTPFILLNSDRQEWNRKGDHILIGHVNSDRKVILRSVQLFDFRIIRASVQVKDFEETKSSVSLHIKNPAESEPVLWFSCSKPPQTLLFKSEKINFSDRGRYYEVYLPGASGEGILEIKY